MPGHSSWYPQASSVAWGCVSVGVEPALPARGDIGPLGVSQSFRSQSSRAQHLLREEPASREFLGGRCGRGMCLPPGRPHKAVPQLQLLSQAQSREAKPLGW